MTDPLPAPLLTAHDLACERSERLLFNRLNFTLTREQLLLVQGGNGQGKTSLLRLLTGLGRPDAGEVRWRGEPIARCRDRYHREMAYLGHTNGIKDELNPVENLRFHGALHSRAFDPDAAVATLKRLGLSRCLDLPCRALSFGQRRRVALSALLLAGASLWILDEPLTGLDTHAVALVEGLIRDHLQAGGMVVATTHQVMNLEGVNVQRLLVGNAATPHGASAEAF
ncbi:cytochrome c biogenesis heme-transporting ATPase CcmA [Hydrogenophaga sp.]|uniref:cytochrome c biogenesis heme-transporting ATPase CcmA n=1 Tax=Hydrogenophaga sp. TaxID=1904254 RepID=UPI00260CCF3B|nr:cytochrome c biogenesis heme-transporting ATPase CcmA [Hydrogenophaga sp.]MDM7950934.1 cytochrome c biogenesis heme-transporting ATPase CcmA [Hydrogenophaga sp.]